MYGEQFTILDMAKFPDPNFLEKIFSEHMGRNLQLAVGDLSFQEHEGFNDFYNSRISRARLEFKEEEEGIFHTFNIIIKKPTGLKLHKLLSKFSHLFTREVVMYELIPREFPTFNEIMQICYYGDSTYSNDTFNESWMLKHKNCCCLFICCCGAPDEGYLILEDLTENGFESLDKRNILSVDHVKAAFIAIAKFHGVWFKYLHDNEFSSQM